MNCRATTKNGQPCSKESKYGVLCPVHASQLANCPTIYRENKIKREHLTGLTIFEIDESKMYFLQDHPYSPAQSSNPMAYRKQVLLYLEQVGESTVKGIVEYLNVESKFEMTGSKIGQLMRVMMLEGTIARKHVCIEGHGVSVYALNRVLGSEGPEEE